MSDDNNVSGFVPRIINSIQHVLSKFTGRKLYGTYFLTDDDWKSLFHQRSASIETSILELHRLRYTLLSNLYGSVFLKNSSMLLNEFDGSLNFRFSSALCNASDIMEFGTGLGLGFQVYCDDSLIITSGGGGGGGLFYSSHKRTLNFGHGGGGGIQIATSIGSDTFISLGGGGGCGTCEMKHRLSNSSYQNTIDATVLCGVLMDEDSVSIEKLRGVLKMQYSKKTLDRSCRQIRVQGGGGGGGGFFVSNLSTVGTGYGFGFTLSSMEEIKKSDERDNITFSTDIYRTYYNYSSGSVSNSHNNSNDYPRSGGMSMYGNFSRLLQSGVKSCGGYKDWDCVCKAMFQRINICDTSNILRHNSRSKHHSSDYSEDKYNYINHNESHYENNDEYENTSTISNNYENYDKSSDGEESKDDLSCSMYSMLAGSCGAHSGMTHINESISGSAMSSDRETCPLNLTSLFTATYYSENNPKNSPTIQVSFLENPTLESAQDKDLATLLSGVQKLDPSPVNVGMNLNDSFDLLMGATEKYRSTELLLSEGSFHSVVNVTTPISSVAVLTAVLFLICAVLMWKFGMKKLFCYVHVHRDRDDYVSIA